MDDLIFLSSLVAFALIVVAAYRGGRREGYEEGVAFGVVSERLRRLELERQVEDRTVRRAMSGDEKWQEELDV